MASSSGISFAGLGSGIDSKAIIDILVAVRAKPIDLLSQRKAEFQDLKKQFQALRERLKALETAADDLSKSSKLLAYSASSSSESIVSAKADGSAKAGSFTLTVNSLAQAEVQASQGYADYDTTTIGTGTFKVTVDGTTHDITLGTGQDTLEGLRDAINDADAGVTATIVNEGTGANPYRLVIASNKTGTANAVSIDASGLGGGATPAVFAQTQAASDASVTVNGLTFTRSENSIDDVVPGVELALKSTGTSTITLNVDKEAIQTKVEAYVTAHNDLINFVNGQLKVSGTTNKAGSLSGEASVRKIKNNVLNLFGSSGYPGGSIATLSQVGLAVAKDGTVEFNEAKFSDAVDDNLDDLVNFLAKKGDSITGPGLSVLTVPDDVAFGSYAVSVTQPALKAETAAGSAFSTTGLLVDETLTFTQGTNNVDVLLSAGDTLADAVKKINKALKDGDVDLVASDDNGTLSFVAKQHGSAHDFTVVSDQAALPTSSGVGIVALNAAGQDVAGTIGGVAATGDGQVLTGTGAFDGVEVRFTGAGAGSGTLTVGADGFFVKLGGILDNALLPLTGPIDARLDGIDKTIDDIDDRIDALEGRLDQYKETLERKYAALESIIGGLNEQQASLSALSQSLFASKKK